MTDEPEDPPEINPEPNFIQELRRAALPAKPKRVVKKAAPKKAAPAKRKGGPKPTGTQSKQWCFTINNYTLETVMHIREKAQEDNKLQYIVFQPERGAEGTPHLQGYIAFINRKAMSTVKNWLGDQRAHLEVTRGTPKQASEYCKDETFDPDAGFGMFEHGELPIELNLQGRSNRLLKLKQAIDEGQHFMDVANAEPELFSVAMNNHNALQKYETHVTPKRTKQTAFVVLHGESGTFKSFGLRYINNAYHLQPGHSGLWFGGYVPNVHQCVLMDDFDGRWCRPGDLKRLINHLPCTVEVKGAHSQFRATAVYLTSNWSPLTWWKDPKPQDMEPIQRRITGEFQHVRGVCLVNDQPWYGVLVNKVRGRWAMHPLHHYLTVVPGGDPTVRRLPMELLADQLDTPMNSEAEDDFFNNLYK